MSTYSRTARFLILIITLNFNHIIFAKTLNIKSLDLDISDSIKLVQNNFSEQIKSTVDKINHSQVIVALAPAGGSKITPFKQLDLDGLVIIDWLKTGSPQDIINAFSKPDLRHKLHKSVTEGLTNGAMNTSSVLATPLSAQIISRLHYELDAKNIVISYWLSKIDKSNLETKRINIDENLWAHGLVNESDPVLATIYSFDMASSRKVLIVLSYLITSDYNLKRQSLPFTQLQDLAIQPYSWLYHSADGLFFFSNKDNNGLQLTSKKLLEMIKPGGGVILDYPTFFYYTDTCDNYNNITSMCGRKNLEAYGLNLLQNINVTSSFVFGYCHAGKDLNDSVRIYQKPGANYYSAINNLLFDFSKFEQVGDLYQIEFD